MANKVLALLMVVAVAGVALGSLWLSAPGDADASGHSATRSFSSSSVAPGEEITVTIQVDNFGGFGQIVETLPFGFTSQDADGQTVTKPILGGPQAITYTVTASDNPGPYTFSGTLADHAQDERTIGGADTVTVTAPPPTPDTDPSATRSFSAASVDPGGTVTVTIQADDYGGLGRILETLPAGFTSPDASGQTVTLRLLQEGPQSSSYTVTASDNPGSYTFYGVLESEDKSETTVGGASNVTITAPPATPDADPSATRSFSATSVDPGGTVTVTIRADDYGGLGRIVETLPSGFTSTDGSGQTVTLRLLQEGPQTRSYAVTASENPGSYTFYGVLESEDKSETTVGGPSTVTVNAPPGPSARRSFSTTSVDPGGTVTVIIRADNYGGLGRVVETLPSGFTSPDASGQTVTLRLLQEGPQTRSYTVTASEDLGSHTFSGVLESEDKSQTTVAGSSSVTVRVVAPEPQVNRAPAFRRSSTTRPIDENSASGANVGAVVRATDADGDRLTYSLTGTDAGSFTINSGTGQIMVGAGTTLDYETKASYMVTVTATDPVGDSDSIAVTITVTNVVELGVVSGDATPEYVENGMGAVATYTADGPVTAGWSVSGADMDDFDISNEGVLSFASAPDFENPTDADMDNTYMVTVKAEAGREMEMVEVTVMVTNVDELEMVSGEASVSYAENDEDAVATYTASGAMADDAMWTLMGDDAGDFSISSAGVLSFRSSPDFEAPMDDGGDNTYMVTVKAEAGGEMAMQPVTVTVTNEEETGEVTLWAGMDALTMAPQVGETITGAVMDPDGGVTGETWQWARTTTPDMMASWMDIAGETNADYMVAAGDTGHYLRVMATYTDAVGTDMDMEYSIPTMMVVAEAEDTLFAEYDANRNGQIDKSEVIKAINDYLFGEVGIISKADVIRLINLYLFG